MNFLKETFIWVKFTWKFFFLTFSFFVNYCFRCKKGYFFIFTPHAFKNHFFCRVFKKSNCPVRIILHTLLLAKLLQFFGRSTINTMGLLSGWGDDVHIRPCKNSPLKYLNQRVTTDTCTLFRRTNIDMVSILDIAPVTRSLYRRWIIRFIFV